MRPVWLPVVAAVLHTTSTVSAPPLGRRLCHLRGPAWVHMHVLIADGLAQAGEAALAQYLKRSVMGTFAKSGFCEYYDPLTGEGLGGKVFSWTAASYLHWV